MDADSKSDAELAYGSGVTAERERVVSILGSPEAEGRLPVAMQCVQFGLPYGASIDLLRAVPRPASAAEQRTSDFAAAMAAIGNPRVQASSDVDWGAVEREEIREEDRRAREVHTSTQPDVHRSPPGQK